MSDDRPRPAGLFRRLRAPAALNYLVMVGAGLFVYGLMMMSRGNDFGAILAVMIAAAGILARWTAAPVLILLLTTYLTIDPGFLNLIGFVTGEPWLFPRPGNGFNLEDVLLAAGLLAYTIGHYRLTAMVHQGMPTDPTVQRATDPNNPPRRPPELAGTDELAKTLIIAGSAVIVGETAWTVLSLVGKKGPTYPPAFTEGTTRFLMLAWVVGLALMITSAALVYLRGSGMTRAEAAVLLRDEFFQETRRETDRLQRWRKWFKERVAARRRAGK